MQLITTVTPSLCRLMQIPLPKLSTSELIDKVVDEAEVVLRNGDVEKCFVYAPDAIGDTLFREYSDEFKPVLRIAPLHVLLRSVLPPKTPVCFASMFTGAMPEDHGIRMYKRPILRCDTLFDALARSKKRVAIVAVEGCSIALIFRERPLSYFIEAYDQQVNNRVIHILGDKSNKSDFDFILAYNQAYDDTMHRTAPRSPEALRAMKNHIDSFKQLAEAFLRRYESYSRLVVFLPDHGEHVGIDGHGIHESDIQEDVEVRSFWGVYEGKNHKARE